MGVDSNGRLQMDLPGHSSASSLARHGAFSLDTLFHSSVESEFVKEITAKEIGSSFAR